MKNENYAEAVTLVERIRSELFEMRDEKYRDFNAALIPTVDNELVIGVRTPLLRAYAKRMKGTRERDIYLSADMLPHKYYEENNLHAFLIEQETEFDSCIERLRVFLPYVDNWATCDMMMPKVLGKNKKALYEVICEWIADTETYTIRYGLRQLMAHFLDEDFSAEVLEIALSVRSAEYYVNMMTAWFFATALTKRYDDAIVYITDRRLSEWVHNKTISKACDSFLVSREHKEELKKYRIK